MENIIGILICIALNLQIFGGSVMFILKGMHSSGKDAV